VTASLRTPGSLTPPVEVLACGDPSRDCARTISVVMIVETASTAQTTVPNLKVFIGAPFASTTEKMAHLRYVWFRS
jgi:hypothetical protein